METTARDLGRLQEDGEYWGPETTDRRAPELPPVAWWRLGAAEPFDIVAP